MSEQKFKKLCQAHKMKFTSQRFNIYSELAKAKDHPSTETIFQRVRKQNPNISFDTVNRTVLSLAECGIIRVVDGYSGGRCFDPNMDPHHHLRCIKCNTIIDFYNKTYDKLEIPKKLPGFFSVLNKKVVLEGICKKCQSTKRKEAL